MTISKIGTKLIVLFQKERRWTDLMGMSENDYHVFWNDHI